jgi:hypothetical protein
MSREVNECDLRKLRSEHDANLAMGRTWSDDGLYRLNTRRVIPTHLRLAETPPACRGVSCRQGRVECREACNPLPEMACAEPDPEPDYSGRRAVWLGLWISVMAVGLVAMTAYLLADPILAALRKVAALF